MKNVNDIRADILAAMQAAAEPESGDLNKSAHQVLADAIEGYLTASTATASKSAPKGGKAIKSKGIALTAAVQGGPANLRPVSLMMKANLDELTPEQRAALERLGYIINQGGNNI